MHSVKVNKHDLLVTLEINRDKHRDLFLKAQEGYRQRVIEELDEMLQLARDGKELRVTIEMQAPQDHTEDYDRVIAMLKLSVDETVTIDSVSFEQYVLDKWAWSRHANFINQTYSAGGKL